MSLLFSVLIGHSMNFKNILSPNQSAHYDH